MSESLIPAVTSKLANVEGAVAEDEEFRSGLDGVRLKDVVQGDFDGWM